MDECSELGYETFGFLSFRLFRIVVLSWWFGFRIGIDASLNVLIFGIFVWTLSLRYSAVLNFALASRWWDDKSELAKGVENLVDRLSPCAHVSSPEFCEFLLGDLDLFYQCSVLLEDSCLVLSFLVIERRFLIVGGSIGFEDRLVTRG